MCMHVLIQSTCKGRCLKFHYKFACKVCHFVTFHSFNNSTKIQNNKNKKQKSKRREWQNKASIRLVKFWVYFFIFSFQLVLILSVDVLDLIALVGSKDRKVITATQLWWRCCERRFFVPPTDPRNQIFSSWYALSDRAKFYLHKASFPWTRKTSPDVMESDYRSNFSVAVLLLRIASCD